MPNTLFLAAFLATLQVPAAPPIVPERVDPYKMVVISVDDGECDQAVLRVIGQVGFEAVQVFGPMRVDGRMEWSWTGPPDRYLVMVDCYSAGAVRSFTSNCTIGDPPPPLPPGPDPPGPNPPQPDPDEVPADAYDNVGRAAFQHAPRGPPESAELAALYREIADGLATATYPTIGDAQLALQAKRRQFSWWQPDWAVLWFPEIAKRWDSSWPMEKAQVIEFSRAVATGLEARK